MASVFAGCLIAAGLSAASAAHAGDCQLVKMSSFDLSKGGDARPYIPVSVNGTSTVFLVDTGGAFSVLSSAVADAQNLTMHRIPALELYTAGGDVLNQYVKVKSLGIGPLAARDVKMVVEQGKPGEIGGTLAPDLLRNFDLDFDFANKTLNLFSPDHCPGRVVYWAAAYATVPFKMTDRDDHIQVPVTLDGHDFTAVIDTGATTTALSATIANNLYGIDEKSPGAEAIPGAKPDSLLRYRYRFKTLTLSGVAVNNPKIAILPDLAEEAFYKHSAEAKADSDPVYGVQFHGPRIVLGMDVLSRLHLYVAYGEKTLYVTAAGAGHPAPAAGTAAN